VDQSQVYGYISGNSVDLASQFGGCVHVGFGTWFIDCQLPQVQQLSCASAMKLVHLVYVHGFQGTCLAICVVPNSSASAR
jgi:hypothetical protein